jgi:hypothetical protein
MESIEISLTGYLPISQLFIYDSYLFISFAHFSRTDEFKYNPWSKRSYMNSPLPKGSAQGIPLGRPLSTLHTLRKEGSLI